MDERKEYTYSKSALRRELALRRNGAADKPRLSRAIAEKALPLCRGKVMVYVSMGSEVDTRFLISELLSRTDIEVFAPYTVDGTITPRKLKKLASPNKIGNLCEDCYTDCDNSPKIDYSITPLLGFNDEGYRIGYGKGCYDRFFVQSGAYRIGLAFDFQRIKFAPDSHDLPLDCCVTDKSVIYF